MLTFKQFVSELATEDVLLSAAEVHRMTERFGKKVLQLGHLQDDGSILVPVDCILTAAHSLGSRRLMDAAEALQSETMVSMLQSVEVLVERVAEARKRRLAEMVQEFQSEPDEAKAHQQWKDIEHMVFGVHF
ncbi:MAG: hypothetical protein ACKV22_05980 [Bryobacteraceae bacterium]